MHTVMICKESTRHWVSVITNLSSPAKHVCMVCPIISITPNRILRSGQASTPWSWDQQNSIQLLCPHCSPHGEPHTICPFLCICLNITFLSSAQVLPSPAHICHLLSVSRTANRFHYIYQAQTMENTLHGEF